VTPNPKQPLEPIRDDGTGRGRVCVVVPAYNEAGRIGGVLEILAQVDAIDEIIVVDDGSTDGTSEAVNAHPISGSGRLRLLRHTPNRGKGAAMRAGAEATSAPVLVYFDADLIGLTPHHVESLSRPVAEGGKAMALGVFRGGRGATTLAQVLAPNISGQRAIRRDVLLSVPRLTEAGYGVELAITSYVLAEGLPIARVVLQDVTHPMKEEKLGVLRGAVARTRMYWQMLPYVLQRAARRLRGRP
jgi:glycosyltransferase involved in cell wall biosynthesis